MSGCRRCGADVCQCAEIAGLELEVARLQKLLKMAEDELIESDNHGRAQSNRADALEAQKEHLLSHVKNAVGEGWVEAEAEEIRSYLRSVIKDCV